MKIEKRNIIKIVLVILILAFMAVSFMPCIKETESTLIGKIEKSEIVRVNDSQYCPMFCAVISVFELLLIFISKKVWSKIVRFILNLIKIAVPLPLLNYMDNLFGGGAAAIYINYSFNRVGYLIIGIGVLIAILNLIDIFMYKRN